MKCCGNCVHSAHIITEQPCNKCRGDTTNFSKFEPVHACSTCKYEKKKITEEPCLNCDIRLRNDKWEAKDDSERDN